MFWKKHRIIKNVCCAILVMVVVFWLMTLTAFTRTIYTCTLCRTERTDKTLVGWTWKKELTNEFTAWHETHRPPHQHQWGRLTCTHGFSIFGTTTYFACGPRHPAADISPNLLWEFVKQADTNTINIYFNGITSTNREEQKRAVQMAWDKAPKNFVPWE